MKVRGRGREAVTVREGVADAVQMDVDSGVGGRERIVRAKMIENGLCKMMLKNLRVVRPSLRHSVMPLLPQRADREWARNERDRYRRIWIRRR
jgi:hypothetical protein